jgi:hypothetical protein
MRESGHLRSAGEIAALSLKQPSRVSLSDSSYRTRLSHKPAPLVRPDNGSARLLKSTRQEARWRPPSDHPGRFASARSGTVGAPLQTFSGAPGLCDGLGQRRPPDPRRRRGPKRCEMTAPGPRRLVAVGVGRLRRAQEPPRTDRSPANACGGGSASATTRCLPRTTGRRQGRALACFAGEGVSLRPV